MASGTATVKANGGLNVRKGAGTSYAKIGALANGTKVNYSAEKSGWLQIKYNGATGYISKQYTSVTPASTGSSTQTSGTSQVSSTSKSVEVTASALNVRKGAGTNYGKLGTLSKGKVVQVTGESNGWYRIDFNGQAGWISGQYTKSVSSSGSTTPSPETSKPSTSETSVNEKYTVTATSLNVRSGAGTKNSKIGSLSYAAVVTAVAESNGWLKIQYNKGYGWICDDYVEKGVKSTSGNFDTGVIGAGGLHYLSTKAVAKADTGRKTKKIVDLWTKKAFDVSWDSSPGYHSDCTPMTVADTTIFKAIRNPNKSPDDPSWKNTSSWSWDARPAAIQLKDGRWVACGYHQRPHAAIMGGKPGSPFQNQSNTRPSTGWAMGGHFCLYYGDSPGGTPKCNDAAKTAKDMSL